MVSQAEQFARAKKARRRPRKARAVKVRRKVCWRCGIRELRERHGLSIRDVAEAVGLSVGGLWDIERGTDPQLTTAVRIAGWFGVSVCDIWADL